MFPPILMSNGVPEPRLAVLLPRFRSVPLAEGCTPAEGPLLKTRLLIPEVRVISELRVTVPAAALPSNTLLAEIFPSSVLERLSGPPIGSEVLPTFSPTPEVSGSSSTVPLVELACRLPLTRYMLFAVSVRIPCEAGVEIVMLPLPRAYSRMIPRLVAPPPSRPEMVTFPNGASTLIF